jgi:hypothetical protein
LPEAEAHVFSTKARVPYLATAVQVSEISRAFVSLGNSTSLLPQQALPKLCADPSSSGVRGALQGAGMILSDAANTARAKASDGAPTPTHTHLHPPTPTYTHLHPPTPTYSHV